MEGASIEVCPHHIPMRIQKRGGEGSRVENSGVVYKGRNRGITLGMSVRGISGRYYYLQTLITINKRMI